MRRVDRRDKKRAASGNYVRHDAYWAKAREEGFAARSVYKLEEVDREHRLLTQGAHVLDLGCAPGSWLQYAAGRVGPRGMVLGVDMEKVTLSLPACVQTLQLDMNRLTPDLVPAGFAPVDALLSDLAPHTTGIRDVDQARAFDLSARAVLVGDRMLKAGGHLLVKTFQGPDTQRLLQAVRQRFADAKAIRPKATRKPSFEVYILGKGFRGPPTSQDVLSVL